MEIRTHWYWFSCEDEECDANGDPFCWGSEQPEPDREWCSCNSPELPKLLGYGTYREFQTGNLV